MELVAHACITIRHCANDLVILNKVVLHIVRGFAKLKKIQKNWIDLTPPTPVQTSSFFGNQSLTWTYHSNHDN